MKLWQILVVIALYLAFASHEVWSLWQWEADGGVRSEPGLTWMAYDLAGKPGVFVVTGFPALALGYVLVQWWRSRRAGDPAPASVAPKLPPPSRVSPPPAPASAHPAATPAPRTRDGVPVAPPPPPPR